MTQWDVVMEPAVSTIAKAWIWHDGGAHFGVPLSNYAGWLLTSWLFYQAFAHLSRTPAQLPVPSTARGRGAPADRDCILFEFRPDPSDTVVIGQSGEVMDAAGLLWRVGDLRAATVVTMLFTMFFTSLLAALRLATDRTDP